MSDRNPTLEFIGQSNPKDATPVTFRLGFDQPKSGTNKNGEWFLYGVTYLSGPARDKSTGEWLNPNSEVAFFATPTLHGMIQSTGARKGDVIEVLRLGEGTSTNWYVERQGGPAPQPQQPQEPWESPGPSPAPPQQPQAPQQAPQPRLVDFQDKRDEYRIAMRLAMQDIQWFGQKFPNEMQDAVSMGGNVNLNAMAFTYLNFAKDTGTDLREYVIEQSMGDGDE